MSELKIKDSVRRRDGERCAKGGMDNYEDRMGYGKKLEVHRTTPGSAYTLVGCITVCRDCHADLHSPRRVQRRIARKLRIVAARSDIPREDLLEYLGNPVDEERLDRELVRVICRLGKE